MGLNFRILYDIMLQAGFYTLLRQRIGHTAWQTAGDLNFAAFANMPGSTGAGFMHGVWLIACRNKYKEWRIS